MTVKHSLSQYDVMTRCSITRFVPATTSRLHKCCVPRPVDVVSFIFCCWHLFTLGFRDTQDSVGGTGGREEVRGLHVRPHQVSNPLNLHVSRIFMLVQRLRLIRPSRE